MNCLEKCSACLSKDSYEKLLDLNAIQQDQSITATENGGRVEIQLSINNKLAAQLVKEKVPTKGENPFDTLQEIHKWVSENKERFLSSHVKIEGMKVDTVDYLKALEQGVEKIRKDFQNVIFKRSYIIIQAIRRIFRYNSKNEINSFSTTC